MEELGEQALGKLQNMTDEEFADSSLRTGKPVHRPVESV